MKLVKSLNLYGYLLALGFVSGLFGATGSVMAQAGDGLDHGMRVELSLSKTDIQVGEPIYLRIDIENVNAPLRVGNFGARMYLSEGNDIELMVQKPGELPQRYTGSEDPAVYSAVELNLNNGESMDQFALLLYEASSFNGYLFNSPGTYKVYGAVTANILRESKKSRFVLPPTEVTVHAPSGKDAEAFTSLNSKEMARALHTLQAAEGESAAILAKAKDVAYSYPDSVYAPLSRLLYAMATYRMETSNFAPVIKEYEAFLKLYPGHAKAPDAGFMLSAINSRMENNVVAQDWYFFVKDAYPRYALFRREHPLSARFHFAPAEANRQRPWWLYEKPWLADIQAAQVEKPTPPEQHLD